MQRWELCARTSFYISKFPLKSLSLKSLCPFAPISWTLWHGLTQGCTTKQRGRAIDLCMSGLWCISPAVSSQDLCASRHSWRIGAWQPVPLPVSMTHLCWEASVCAAGARCHTSALCEHSWTWLSSWEALCGLQLESGEHGGKKYRGGFALLGQEGCAGTWLSDTFPAAHRWLASAVGQALECAGSVGSLA